MDKTLQKYQTLALPVIEELGLYLYDVEYNPGQKLLRLYIMHEDSKTADIDDCVKVDRAMSEPIEAEDWIPEEITLEVSSPGVYRKLKTVNHFNLALGERAQIQLRRPFSESEAEGLSRKVLASRKFLGKIKQVGDSWVEMVVEDKTLRIGLEDMKKATLDPEHFLKK